MKNSFKVWLETLKTHVNKIENYEALSHETAKFVFENAAAHIVLGWALIEEGNVAKKIVNKLHLSSSYGKFTDHVGMQAMANQQGQERVAEAEKVIPWWKMKTRFETFARYVAMLLNTSVKAPYETIFDKLSVELGLVSKAKKISKVVASRGHGAPHFAEAVAYLISSELKNIDVRDVLAESISDKYNLSVLLGEVEKRLRDVGFIVGTLYDESKKSPKKPQSK